MATPEDLKGKAFLLPATEKNKEKGIQGRPAYVIDVDPQTNELIVEVGRQEYRVAVDDLLKTPAPPAQPSTPPAEPPEPEDDF